MFPKTYYLNQLDGFVLTWAQDCYRNIRNDGNTKLWQAEVGSNPEIFLHDDSYFALLSFTSVNSTLGVLRNKLMTGNGPGDHLHKYKIT